MLSSGQGAPGGSRWGGGWGTRAKDCFLVTGAPTSHPSDRSEVKDRTVVIKRFTGGADSTLFLLHKTHPPWKAAWGQTGGCWAVRGMSYIVQSTWLLSPQTHVSPSSGRNGPYHVNGPGSGHRRPSRGPEGLWAMNKDRPEIAHSRRAFSEHKQTVASLFCSQLLFPGQHSFFFF